MEVQFQSEAVIHNEDGYTVRRLYPWQGRVESPWGSAWVVIQPGMYSTPHWHDEEETFLILSGSGEMIVDGETKAVAKGDPSATLDLGGVAHAVLYAFAK